MWLSLIAIKTARVKMTTGKRESEEQRDRKKTKKENNLPCHTITMCTKHGTFLIHSYPWFVTIFIQTLGTHDLGQ